MSGKEEQTVADETTTKAPRARRTRGESSEAEAAERGSYGVFDEAGNVLAMDSSEVKAYRAAEPFRARIQFWPNGATRAQVLEALDARMPSVKP